MASPLAFPQTVTIHFKYISNVIVSGYALDPVTNQLTVTFQLQSDKTRAYKEYSNTYIASAAQIATGTDAMIEAAYENVWATYYADMVAFIAGEVVKPYNQQVFDVPIYG